MSTEHARSSGIMLNGTPLSTIVVKFLTDTATPDDKIQLEEWASLSVENRKWLNRFSNPEWLISKIEFINSIDLERCAAKLNLILDAQCNRNIRWSFKYLFNKFCNMFHSMK